MTESPEAGRAGPARPPDGPIAGFEAVYRANFGCVTGFFARRSTDPQEVADLTSDTFVQAIRSFASFDAARGTPRAWLLGIARNVFARHCESRTRTQDVAARLAGRRPIDIDEAAELVVRIDAERAGRVLFERLASLSAADREVVELVDLIGLAPSEAAAALQVSPGALRIRLFRARQRLRAAAGQKKGED
ncbi:RNA polymerase sigma factor [Kribbella sandramycini]|uniref:RNA polymerase sigma factor n=1 Tax=Kribbella sandramycini TaxID=60450 RepID=A0A7Y4L9N6_9ACTN|nr:RNA polymerase sigma factor [Kribbella sandramycini]MBB6570244.1 RNA polymerase sigma-70 factor (ECF subfamily) [Kribbella sandramycini]NOL45837.1 RNA polymerase sigma factor [Kribbella sandramycini]